MNGTIGIIFGGADIFNRDIHTYKYYIINKLTYLFIKSYTLTSKLFAI